MAAPATVAPPAGAPPVKEEPLKVEPKKEGAFLSAPATIVVSLPADAKLSIDDLLTKSTDARRVFTSPALEPGKEFSYTLKATITRDGQPLTTIKQVAVRAGEETRVTLDFPVASVVQK